MSLAPPSGAARMPQSEFHGIVPLYTEVAILLEHRGWQLGETADGQGLLTQAGWAIAKWARARARLAHQRGKNGYRLLEAELAMLLRSQQLSEIPDLRPETFTEVEVAFAKAASRFEPNVDGSP